MSEAVDQQRATPVEAALCLTEDQLHVVDPRFWARGWGAAARRERVPLRPDVGVRGPSRVGGDCARVAGARDACRELLTQLGHEPLARLRGTSAWHHALRDTGPEEALEGGH